MGAPLAVRALYSRLCVSEVSLCAGHQLDLACDGQTDTES